MAKQVGPLYFTGTVDDLIFYKLGDQYYMRSKGSYKSGKQMRRDPKYKRTLEKANQFGKAATITKEVYYRHLPRVVRKHGLFGKLTGMVNGWLQQGKRKAEVVALLIAHCQTLVPRPTATKVPASVAAPRVKTRQTPPTQQKAAIPSTEKPVTMPPAHRVKQARYLPRWKVKRNGRLQIPGSANRLPTITHPPSHVELVSVSDNSHKGRIGFNNVTAAIITKT